MFIIIVHDFFSGEVTVMLPLFFVLIKSLKFLIISNKNDK